MRKDLDYLGYLAGDAPASDISGALQELIETGRAPFVLADSIARIRRLTTSNTAQARAEYDLLADVYPFHPEIEALAAELGIANPTARIAELSAAGDHAAAVELGRDLLSKNPVDTSIIDRALSSALFALAREEAGGGALEAALAHYSEAIDLRDGDFAAALNNRALLRAKGDDTYLALLDINRAIVLDPENSLYHANQCLFLRLRGQLEAALTSCEKAVEVGQPENRGNRSWVYLQRGTVRRLLGDVGGAVADFRKSLQFARTETILQVQELMTAAGLYSEEVDGRVNDALLQAAETCIRSEECYAQAIEQMGRTIDFMQ